MKSCRSLLSTLTHIKLRHLFTNWLPHAWHLKYTNQWSAPYLHKHDLKKGIQVLADQSIRTYNQQIMNLRSSLMVKGVTENIAFPKSSNVYFTCLSSTPTLILLLNHQHLLCKNLAHRTFDSFLCQGGQRYFSTNPNEQEIGPKL